MSRRDCVIFTCVAAFLLVSVSFYSTFNGNNDWRILDRYRKPSDHPPSSTLPTPYNASAEENREEAPTPTPVPILPQCRNFPNGTSDIMLVMKTGATAAFNRLPIHLFTTLECVDDFLLFSDMEQIIGDRKIYNALDEVSDVVKNGNSDFDLYRKLQEYQKIGGNPLLLGSDNKGWNLDKYKFIHMIVKTYRMKPNAPWYFFVEADTSFNWENLVTFLKKLDPKKPYYIGSNAYVGDVEFAHGGTGFLLSNAAVKKFIKSQDDVAAKYDPKMSQTCCGDAMLAEALRDSGILLTKAWPMTNGEKPITLPYSSPGHWCQPIITMHHVNQIEVSDIWTWEQERRSSNGTQRPILIRDLFYKFVSPHLTPSRDTWDNLSNDITYTPPKPKDTSKKNAAEETFGGKKWDDLTPTQQTSFHNFENCKKACEENDECLQFRYGHEECALSKSIKFGERQVDPSKEEKKRSGWLVERIREREKKWGECKEPVKFDYREPGKR